MSKPLLHSILLHGVLGLAFLAFWWAHRVIELRDAVTYVELRERAAAPQSPDVPRAKPREPVAQPKKIPVPDAAAPAQSSAATENTSSSAVGEGTNENVRGSYEVATLPVLVRENRVPYPPEARAKGVSGDVVAEIVVSSLGKVVQVRVIQSPDPLLSTAAEAALQQFEFKAAVLDGKPVAVKIKYRYRFILEN